MWTTPELVPPLLTTTPHQRENVSALDRFNMHRCPTRWVFSGTGFELVTRQATIRYLYHSATAATSHVERKILKYNLQCHQPSGYGQIVVGSSPGAIEDLRVEKADTC
ncbi:uncharacterized protein TNCV_2007051 [Trichonephila clavipes]|nr:uncharacterized protein TNCV_2007051 [Trichonephila clavipes]